ncbi:nose resistant to fluoxetine protein 6-like [Anopheles bellator]|uniref:nose resistant to fluoxetine protein 6-like n=1 Tax=Anopheles bellator TaxID=139047 RepID=UPI0026496FF9|nr:nose resistant to fluoxetine protein 6-like [Anopheles bellator]
MKFQLLVVIVWCIVCAISVQCRHQPNMTEYKLMPRVFQFDDYDDCLNDDPTVPGVYCMVKAVVHPNQSSRVWRVIEEYSRNWKQHLNHAHLDRGICLQNCALKLASLDKTIDLAKLVVPKFEIDFPYIIKNGTFRDVDEYRRNYSTMLAQCVNYDLMQQHGIRAYTEIEYCDSNTKSYPIDSLEIAFLVVLATLLTVVLVSSWYDHHCKTQHGLDHYKTELTSKVSMAFVSFSIIRNWYRLTSRGNDTLSHSIRYIHAVRFMIFMMINMGHNILYAQPRTAMVIERKYDELDSMVIANGSHVVTTFFFIGALMLVLSLVSKLEETGKKLGIIEIIMISIARYIRLTPVYAFMMMLEATWLVRYLDGPLWRKGFETSRTYCRRHWWANLLYINNYYATDEPCMQQSWYLAADFHMFVYGLVVCAIVLRFPKLRTYILSFLLLVWSMAAAILVYINGYEAVTVLPPQPLRFFFWYWGMYHDTYLPTHMNLVNYTAAIMGAFYVLHLKKTNFKAPKMFALLWFLGVLAMPAYFISGYFIYSNIFETPAVWMALLYPLGRIFYTALMVLFTVGFFFRASKFVLRMLNVHFFGVLGRLTYCAYLCHLFITRAASFGTRRSVNIGVFEMNTSSWATLVMSYVLGWVLCLTLESPFLALQKLLFESLNKKRPRVESVQK